MRAPALAVEDRVLLYAVKESVDALLHRDDGGLDRVQPLLGHHKSLRVLVQVELLPLVLVDLANL